MKQLLRPLFIAILFAAAATAANAQGVRTVFSVAKITLPEGAKLELVDGYDGTKMYAVYFPGSPHDQVVMIANKTLSKSESRWTNEQWAQKKCSITKLCSQTRSSTNATYCGAAVKVGK